jgi:hypothetical protein
MEILQAIDTERIRTLRDRREIFWLDLADPRTSDLDPLRELVTIHPLAFEDVIPHADEMRDSFRDVHDHLDRAAGQLGSLPPP